MGSGIGTLVDPGLTLQLSHPSPSAQVLPEGLGLPSVGSVSSCLCCHSTVVMEYCVVPAPRGPCRDPACGVTAPGVGPATHM